ncbi:hypothetical protein BGZ72_000238, partial [Mortierella alpina]
MSNSTNSSPPGIGGSISNRALAPSLATRGRSASDGTAAVSPQQGSLSSDGDNRSISSQGPRKRDKFLSFFRSPKPEGKDTTGASGPNIHDTPTLVTKAEAVHNAGSSIKVTSAAARIESTADMTMTCSNIFPRNLTRPSSGIELPKPGARIDTTPQLALCGGLLNSAPSQDSELILEKDSNQSKSSSSQDIPTDGAHRDWVKNIKENPIEQYHIRW